MIFQSIEQTKASKAHGEASRKRRENAGWSVDKAAGALGITADEVNAIEDGRGELIDPTEAALQSAERFGIIKRY